MKKYGYKAINDKGKKIEGVVEAQDAKGAARLLRARNFFIISIAPQKDSFFPKVGLRRVSLEDKVNFTRQLSTMLNSGLALAEGLSILEFQASPAMGKVISEILNEIEGGSNFASALAKEPKIFDKVYISLVQAGEAAGILDVILNRLAENLENSKNLRSRVKSAMIYPVIVIIGMVVVSLIMLVFVIPRLMSFYQEFQAQLPLPTRIFLTLSGLVRTYWWFGLILTGAAVYSYRFFSHFPSFKKRYDQINFRIPVFGKIRQQIMLAEFTRTLGLLVGSGVLLVDALNIVKDSFGSPVYKEALTKATKEVEKGFPLSYSLAQTEVFPPMIPQMISVGEETGKLDEILGRVANYFDQEAEILVKGLTTAIEPFIMILLALGVAFLVIAVIMPIYNLTSQF